MKKLVYLSGCMDGVSIEEGNTWRKKATEFLNLRGLDTFNPYDIHPTGGNYEPNEIHNNDVYYLDRSDVILVNLDIPNMIESSKIPFFTIGEMYLAHAARKPIVAYTNCLANRLSYKAIVTKSFTNLEDAMEYIASTY